MKTLLLLVALAVASAQEPGTKSGNTENGKRLFEKDGCYQCHGYAAQGGRDGPRLAATSLSLTALTRYVRRPLGGMPAFTAKVLSDRELTDIYAYVKAFPPAKPAKDIPVLNQMRDK